MVKGACECGAITYEVGAELGPVTACHCSQCRKISGHFTAATPAPIEAVAIKGEVRWYRSSQRAQRGFCPTCGSYLFWEEFDGLLYLMAGAFEAPTGLQMDGHIYYGDKGDYYEVRDGLPRYQTGRKSQVIKD